MDHYVQTPVTEEEVWQWRIGDRVCFSGTIYSARDAAHQRLVELLANGQALPIPLAGEVIYYVGPSPAKPGKIIGSAGPTTSYRMDSYTLPLLERGLKVMIGKGSRSAEVKDGLIAHRAAYLAAVGGAAALISRCITGAEVVAYPELGPEAIRRLKVKEMPAIVVNDCHGGDLYIEGRKRFQRSG